MSATFAASLVISPALGSVLVTLYGSGFVFLLSTLISVIDVIFIVLFLPEVQQLFLAASEHDTNTCCPF